jgi:hypothetical protein
MATIRRTYGEVSSKTGLKEISMDIRRDGESAKSPALLDRQAFPSASGSRIPALSSRSRLPFQGRGKGTLNPSLTTKEVNPCLEGF